MSDYPTEPPTREKKHNPFAKFDGEILEQVILPKLQDLFVEKGSQIKSKSDMHRLFNEKYGTTISAATFQWWLEKLGITFEKAVIVHGLKLERTDGSRSEPSSGARVAPRRTSAGDDDDVRFDNEMPYDFAKPRGYGDAFGELNKDAE